MEGIILALIYIGVLVVVFSLIAVAMRNLIGLAVAFLVATIIAFIFVVGVAICTLGTGSYFSTWNNVLWFISIFLIILGVIFLLVVIWIRSVRKSKIAKASEDSRMGIHKQIGDHPSAKEVVYEAEEDEMVINRDCEDGVCSTTTSEKASKTQRKKRIMEWL